MIKPKIVIEIDLKSKLDDILKRDAEEIFSRLTSAEKDQIRKAMCNFALDAIHDAEIHQALYKT